MIPLLPKHFKIKSKPTHTQFFSVCVCVGGGGGGQKRVVRLDWWWGEGGFKHTVVKKKAQP